MALTKSEKARRYRAKHKDKIAQKKKDFYEKNREKIRAREKKRYEENKEKRLALAAEYRRNNGDAIREKIRGWQSKNKEKMAFGRKRYKAENRERISHLHAKRRAAHMNATPAWVDHSAIMDIYKEAAYMQLSVDHIVPLQSKLVCGLHVAENLQLLPLKENISKGNRFWPDMSIGA